MNLMSNIVVKIRNTSFNIEKLYMDCIDEKGNCFIVYWAKMDFFLIRFYYSGLVFCDSKGFTLEKSTLREIKKPAIKITINLDHKLLETSVSLIRIDKPIIQSLFKDSENNELLWNCHHPKALAEILYNGDIYKGFGYAETLFLPVKPWNLPIDELRWGRFLSDSYTVIWIKWEGKYPVNKIFLNNIEYNDAIFETDIIFFCNGLYQLKFSDIQVIRKGKLSRLFLKIKILKLFFNPGILNSTEIKYKAKTSLIKNSIVISNDWSLFEIVTWGR
jgi:hypothetical protein